MQKQQGKTAELIAAINVLKLELGQKPIKSVHSYKEGEAQLTKLRAASPTYAKVQALQATAKASASSAAVVTASAAVPAPATPRAPERMASEGKGTKGIPESDLRRFCPAIFATSPNMNKVSERYRMVNTWDLIKPMLQEGYVVTSVQQKRPQKGAEHTMLYTRHMLRLRPTTAALIVGEAFPEVVVVNGHAGQARFQMFTGLFRLVCLNGMVAGTTTDSLNAKHAGDLGAILEEANRIIKSAQEKSRTIEAWLQRKLNKSEQLDFAKAAMQLAYHDQAAFDPANLLVARRDTDRATDLWHVFNVVQENVMRGGIEYRTGNNHAAQTRGFSNVPRTVEFNARLWETAEALAA